MPDALVIQGRAALATQDPAVECIRALEAVHILGLEVERTRVLAVERTRALEAVHIQGLAVEHIQGQVAAPIPVREVVLIQGLVEVPTAALEARVIQDQVAEALINGIGLLGTVSSVTLFGLVYDKL